VGPVALDTSFLIGFLDPADAHHRRAVKELRKSENAPLSVVASAYAETMVRPLADGYGEEIDSFLDSFGVEIVDLDRALARRIAALRSEHPSLPLPDAAVVAAACQREAELLTFDERLRRLWLSAQS